MDDSVHAEPALIPADSAQLNEPGVLVLPAGPRGNPPPWHFALLQAIAVCGIPTQIAVATALIVGARMAPVTSGGLSLEFIATVSFLDTALIALLIRVFLMASGEHSRDVFLGRRRPLGEIGRGLALVPVAFVLVTGLVFAMRALAPSLNNVRENPLAAFMTNPLDTAIFAVVVVLAGGVREELQRGFILHRFGQSLGGMWVGNLVFGLAFGLLHLDQGRDIALAIGLLGLAWGALYIRRGSILMSISNHAGFNAAQVLQQALAASLGLGR